MPDPLAAGCAEVIWENEPSTYSFLVVLTSWKVEKRLKPLQRERNSSEPASKSSQLVVIAWKPAKVILDPCLLTLFVVGVHLYCSIQTKAIALC